MGFCKIIQWKKLPSIDPSLQRSSPTSGTQHPWHLPGHEAIWLLLKVLQLFRNCWPCDKTTVNREGVEHQLSYWDISRSILTTWRTIDEQDSRDAIVKLSSLPQAELTMSIVHEAELKRKTFYWIVSGLCCG